LSKNVISSKRFRLRKARAFHTTANPDIPAHYHCATHRAKAKSWEVAIKKELDAMASLNLWYVIPLTPDMKTVVTTWVFKKMAGKGEIIFKASLCAQGFLQTLRIDFLKTFAPAGRPNSLCALIFFTAANALEFQQINIKRPF
jgi:hypothetical protein